MQKLSLRLIIVVSVITMLFLQGIEAKAQNLGFEATAATPPANWTGNTYTTQTNLSNVRTGLQSMSIPAPQVSGHMGNTNAPLVTTASAGQFLITIAWAKASHPTNGGLHLGYRTGTANTFNPTAVGPSNISTTWTRVAAASAAGVPAGSYNVAVKAYRLVATTVTAVYIDDVIMYASSSSTPDLTAPDIATGGSVAGQNITWTNGTDNGAPASGIGGVVIIRANGTGHAAPVLNDQAMYDPVHGDAGVASFTDNTITWTVVANINNAATQNYTDGTAGAGPYTYVVYMKDVAHNYSPGLVVSTSSAACIDPPDAGTGIVLPAAIQCAGVSRSLNITGATTGIGQTYRWLSSSAQAGTYTYISAPSPTSGLTVNPTETTWYKAELTCNGNTDESAPVEVLVNPGVSGTAFTINKNGSAVGDNFLDFATAINSLGCGVTGHVVFTVTAGSGPYTEQVTIPSISGTSPAATITINGNGETLSFSSSNATERATLKLFGADYVTLDNLNVVAAGSGTTNYGFAVQLVDDADHNTIKNCTITATSTPTTPASNAFAALVISASATLSPVAAGASFCDNNTIANNRITGGNVGISLLSNGSISTVTGNKVTGNIITDFYEHGIFVNGNDNGLIDSNEISRPTRTSVGNFRGITLSGFSSNMNVSRNKIHSPFANSINNVNGAAGIHLLNCEPTAGNENIVSNNMIYNFVNTNSSNTSHHLGIWLLNSEHAKMYYNSILFDDGTTGCTTCQTRGFFVQTAPFAGLEFKNNIVVISRSGSGPKQAIYLEGTGVTFTSDYNDYLITSTTGTRQIGFANGAGHADLAAWKSNAGQDLNSVSVDPVFISATDLHLNATASSIVAAGAPIPLITKDIDGNTRSATNPAIGADEVPPPANIDMQSSALISPASNSSNCYSDETITVAIKNNSINPLNFSLNNVSVVVDIKLDNVLVATYSATLNSGSIGAGDVQNITLINPSATYNMSAAGTYTFEISTLVGGDINAGNNTLTATRIKAPLSAGILTSNNYDICLSGTPLLTATGATGFSTIRWQESNTSVSGFADISGGTTNPFTVPSSITQTTYYRAIAACATEADTADEISVNVFTPSIINTTAAARCGPGTVDLSATGSDSYINWYSTATGGAPVGTGNTFTTPVINNTTTFYVASGNGINTFNIAGPPIGSSSFITALPGFGLRFTVNSSVTIDSLKIRAAASVAGSASIQIKVTDLSDAVLYTGVLHNFSITTTLADYVIPVKISVIPGNYKIVMTYSGIDDMVREATGVTYPFTSAGNEISITAGANGPGTAQTSSAYYWFYDWQLKTGCESPRVPVVATINTMPALTVTANKTICNNAIHQLAVTSTIGDFNSYVWGPQDYLFTDAAATIPYTGGNATEVYVRTTFAETVTYSVNALNSGTGCTNIASSIVTIMPDPVIDAAPPQICISGTTILTLTPATGYGAGSLQWQESSNGVSYNDISLATNTSYTTSTLTVQRYYKTILKDEAGAVCSQAPVITVSVNSFQITGTSPAARCGAGSVDLSATSDPGINIQWYETASGGTAIASGSNFTTPHLNATTAYYVAANTGFATEATGLVNATSNVSTSSDATAGIVFDVLSPCKLLSVDLYPVSMFPNTPGTVTISIISSTGAVLHSKTVNVTGQPPASAVKQTAVLDFDLQTGTDLKIIATRGPGITYLKYEPASGAPVSGNYGYPFLIPDYLRLTSGETSGTTAPHTASLDLYYFFYNWQVLVGCESPRVAVTATVNFPASNAAGTSGTTECAAKVISGATEYNYTDCDAIAVIVPSGASPVSGNVNACVTIDAAVQTVAGEPYVQRHYNIIPASDPSTSTSVITLYFLQSEFDAFNLVKGSYAGLPVNSSDATGKASLRITQYNGTGTTPGNYTGTAVQIDPADANILWNSSDMRWEITFNATGSGGFYVHTGQFVLPVTGLELKAEPSGSINKLTWNTLTETSNKGFEIQRSADGKNFSSIAFVATKAGNGNSTSALNYNYNDEKPFGGNNYYRLKQMDKDGKFTYSNTVLLSRKVKDIVLSGIYPNPTESELNVVIASPQSGKVTIVVTDLSGKVVMQQPMQLVSGNNQRTLNVRSLAAGTYIIKAVCSAGCENTVHRFVKQ